MNTRNLEEIKLSFMRSNIAMQTHDVMTVIKNNLVIE